MKIMPAMCPFCGEEPVVRKWHGGGPRKRIVACENDDCHVRPSVTGSNRVRAVRKWNVRADD